MLLIVLKVFSITVKSELNNLFFGKHASYKFNIFFIDPINLVQAQISITFFIYHTFIHTTNIAKSDVSMCHLLGKHDTYCSSSVP